MYHSITIGTKNTWDDWHLIPVSRPFVTLPTFREKFIEIPGKSGAIDLSTFLTGYPTYNNRKGSWEFYVMHDAWYSHGYSQESLWMHAYAEIADYVHGKKRSVILEDYPNYYYYGLLKLNQYKPGKDYSTITIEYDLDPERTHVTNGNKIYT